MRHIIDAIAAKGRDKDTELLHVTKNELAGLNALKRHFTGSGLSRNPKTGIPEAGWFDQYVAPALPAVAGLAAGALTGGTAAVPVATAVGAATGAGIKGMQGGSTQDVLMGGVMGGIAGYGMGGVGAGLAEGAAATTAEGVKGAATSSALPATATGSAETVAGTSPAVTGDTVSSTNMFQQPASTGLKAPANAFNGSAPTITGGAPGATTTAADTTASAATNTGSGLKMPAEGVKSMGGDSGGVNWNYLASKDAMGNVAPAATGTMGMASLMPNDNNNTSTVPGVNKTLPKAEVYYTPYGERRTRIVAAEGGLMSLEGAYGDYDGAEDGQGIRRYDWGGMVKSIQPGGAWGNATADLYGVVDKNAPWLADITPGGAIGQLQPGRRDWEEKKRQEEEAKANEQKANAAAAAKAQQQADFQSQWQERYNNAMGVSQPQGMAMGGMTPTPARSGIANIGFNKGRYLQGPGDGMSDSIPANIDGKQEARLATGEFVVPADVVSHLGNGDSSAGAKQLHSMMDRARMARTGTKQQGKQINPRKVMPA